MRRSIFLIRTVKTHWKRILLLFVLIILLSAIFTAIFLPNLTSTPIIFVLFIVRTSVGIIPIIMVSLFFISSVVIFLKTQVKIYGIKGLVEIVILFSLILYLALKGLINSKNAIPFFLLFIPIVGLTSIVKIFCPLSFKFETIPTAADVIKAVLLYFFFVLVIGIMILFALSLEIYIFPETFFPSNLFLLLLFYLIYDLAEPKIIAYSFVQGSVLALSIGHRLITGKKEEEIAKEFKLKSYEDVFGEADYKRLPFSLVLKSLLPFVVIYSLIFIFAKGWENRFWANVVFSFFTATYYVISSITYGKKSKKAQQF